MTTTDQSPEAWLKKAHELSKQACYAFAGVTANGVESSQAWTIARDKLYEHLENHPGARPAVEQAVGWIPVAERLPEGENAVSCEVWCQEESDTQPAGPCVMSLDDGEWYSREDTGCWEPGAITHWRPRPHPPGAQAVQPDESVREVQMRTALQLYLDTIEIVENLCMAADGPVTPTHKEITDDELRAVYVACKAALRGTSNGE